MPAVVSSNFLWVEALAQRIPTVVNLGSVDQSLYFIIQVTPQFSDETECTSSHSHYLSEDLVAPGIEPGISGSVIRYSAL
jgi:hypothetical protein